MSFFCLSIKCMQAVSMEKRVKMQQCVHYANVQSIPCL